MNWADTTAEPHIACEMKAGVDSRGAFIRVAAVPGLPERVWIP
jgi:hypothetical protein